MNIQLLALAAAWLVGWALCWRVRTLPYTRDPDPLAVPPSVVIPARDEAEMLPTVLAGLDGQTTPPREVIVVDDGSSDATAAVAAAHGARVITGEPLPNGWTGKAWALWQGIRAARGEIVVCLDADVDPSSHLLARLGRYFEGRGGLVSVQPYHEMRRWWERAAAFFNLVAVMGVGLAAPTGSRVLERTAFGPCLIAGRDPLLTHLAHRSVRHAVIEDVALARRFAASGEPVACFAGGDLVAFRMYDRPGGLVEGFAKNFAAGAATTPWFRLVAIVAWIGAGLVAAVGVLSGSPTGLIVYGAFAAQCFIMLRQLGNFGIVSALVYPVLVVFFVALFAVSLILVGRGEVRWKGRTIRLRDRPGERDE